MNVEYCVRKRTNIRIFDICFLHLAKHSFARCTRSGNVKKKKRKKCHTFWLSSEQYIYMKERSDTRMMETTNVKTSEPHQPALVLNCYVIWLRSKWGSKLTYFSNFAIYYLLVQLRVKSRLKRRVVKWVYFHSQPFSNRLNWRDDTFYSYFLHLLFTLTFYTYFLH